jgi:transposase
LRGALGFLARAVDLRMEAAVVRNEMPFDAHTRSFASLGGVARRGIYDNMRTAVDKVHKGKGRTVNARFAVMCAHYLYDPDFCNVASG